MTKILIITLAALTVTFLVDLVFRRTVESHPCMLGKTKIHHSVLGLALFAAGILIHNDPLLAVGLGMYLCHGFEEIYFEHTKLPKAFFVLISRK